MQITISERYRPFSHLAGTTTVLPGSPLAFQIFPAKIYVYSLIGKEKALIAELSLAVEGPVDDFTVQNDLEKGLLKVWGEGSKGFFRYLIQGVDGGSGFLITEEKSPGQPLIEDSLGDLERSSVSEKETLFCNVPNVNEQASIPLHQPQKIERLSLGSSKKQEWDQVAKRNRMEEILPHWMHLGQQVPSVSMGNEPSLFQSLQEAVSAKRIREIVPLMQSVTATGFEGMLVPRLFDDSHQGFDIPPQAANSPIALLHEGYLLIKKMLLSYSKGSLMVLPALPPEFHCGRMVDVTIDALGEVDIEWAKKEIKKIVIRSNSQADLTLALAKGIKSFRVRRSKADRGQRFDVGSALLQEVGGVYLIDRFEK